MKYRFITEQCSDISVEKMCRFLKVSRSGYYDWQVRGPSRRTLENERLLGKIQVAHSNSRGTYGSPRIYEDLKAAGENCSPYRVTRLMRLNGIKAKARKKFKKTTDSEHKLAIAPNLVNQDFTAADVNQLWLSDITYIWTNEGWLYLAAILDVYSRKIVGWSIKDRLYKEIVTDAINKALRRRKIGRGVVFHSDKGSQYASKAVCDLLKLSGFRQSMSGKGNCYDNAMMESFFHSLKSDIVHGEQFSTRDEARQAVFEYIEIFYNRERRHSGINYMTPVQFELNYSKLLLAA